MESRILKREHFNNYILNRDCKRYDARSEISGSDIYTRINKAIVIPRFSPPQTSIWVSYLPSFSKYALLMTNSPPAIMGVLMACVGSFCLACRSAWLRYSHLKTKLQSKPPLRSAEAPGNKTRCLCDSLREKLFSINNSNSLFLKHESLFLKTRESKLRRYLFSLSSKTAWIMLVARHISNLLSILSHRYIGRCPCWWRRSQDTPPSLDPPLPSPEGARANRRCTRSASPEMSARSR